LDQFHASVAARTKHLARIGYSGHEGYLEVVMLVGISTPRPLEGWVDYDLRNAILRDIPQSAELDIRV